MSDSELNINSDKLIIGILSGTSVDSVDIVLTGIKGTGKNTSIRVIDYMQYEIDEEVRELIFKASDVNTGNVELICKLNFIIGEYFASKIKDFLRKNHLSSEDIYCIGSHGQTIYHFPSGESFMNYPTKSSLQIGDISVISNLTNITTVGDFRTADIAAGGSGAPLVPFLDYILFPPDDKTRLVINIGGIANFTFLDVYSQLSEIVAFDVGPGNMLIDSMMRKLYEQEFDKNGEIAFSGEQQHSIIQKLIFNDAFIHKPPPKSTGREDYGESFLKITDEFIGKYPNEDIISTITEYTTYCIYYSYEKFIDKVVDEIIVSGGGAKNNFIMERLKMLFPKSEIKPLNKNGITVDNKEAVLFAVLANETMNHKTSNLPQVTGADRQVIQGKVSYVR
jgi:anhydro-N-acetylmuramic acid kinase